MGEGITINDMAKNISMNLRLAVSMYSLSERGKWLYAYKLAIDSEIGKLMLQATEEYVASEEYVKS